MMTRFQFVVVVPFLLLATLAISAPVSAQNVTVNVEESQLVVEGNSTLHRWSVDATVFHILFNVPEAWFETVDNWNAEEVIQLRVSVPIRNMDGGRSRMNRDLRNALNADQHPVIVFAWNNLSVKPDSNDQNRATLQVEGELTINGVTRDVAFDSDAELRDGQMIVKGTVSLNMKDYDVDPPTAMLGAIRASEEVSLNFSVQFGREE
ncbi:MAG: YceI family protein [Balneolaceae bacterium]